MAEETNKSHGPWDLSSDYPIEEWKQEVEDDCTRLGYREWVEENYATHQEKAVKALAEQST